MPDQIRNIIAAGERTTRDLFFQAAGGLLEQVALRHRHGRSGFIDNMSYKTVWPRANDYPRVLTPGGLHVVSTSAADAVDSTGARRLLISGCDADGDPQVEIIELQGLAIASSLKTWFWVDFAHVIEMGSPYGNVDGVITVEHQGTIEVGDDPIVAQIEAPFNRSAMSVAIIPNHYSGYIINHEVSAPINQGAEYGFRISSWLDGNGNSVRQIAFPHTGMGGGPWQVGGKASERIHYPALVEMVAWSTVGGTMDVAASFSMLAIHDSYDFSIPADFLHTDDASVQDLNVLRGGVYSMPGSFHFEEPED